MITDEEYRARCEWRKEGFWTGVKITLIGVVLLGAIIIVIIS